MTEPAASSGDDVLRWRWAHRFVGRLDGVIGLTLTSMVSLLGLFGPRLATADPQAMENPTFVRPSRAFPMGTDAVGRDLFSRVAHGAGTSLVIVVAVLVISTVIGVGLGSSAGFFGGILDSTVMRLVDLIQSIPRFLLAIVVVALLGSEYEKLILVLSLTSWTFLARLVRAEVLSVTRRDFVESARSAGASGFRLLFGHVLPNALPAVVVMLPLMASRLVLIEAGLAFLGLADQTRVSLGFLIAEAQPHLRYYWWLSVFPGLVLVALVLGLTLAGEALNDVLNPATAPERKNEVDVAPS